MLQWLNAAWGRLGAERKSLGVGKGAGLISALLHVGFLPSEKEGRMKENVSGAAARCWRGRSCRRADRLSLSVASLVPLSAGI